MNIMSKYNMNSRKPTKRKEPRSHRRKELIVHIHNNTSYYNKNNLKFNIFNIVQQGSESPMALAIQNQHFQFQ